MTAIDEISAERKRQVEVEGWTSGHDDVHRNGEMAGAAACYIMTDLRIGATTLRGHVGALVSDLWPWARHWWKPKDRRRNLIRAGALIVAEIERIDRATPPASLTEDGETDG